MSNYTQVNNYSAKDALASGDPSKKILGANIDAELAAISTAIGSKADSASPTISNPTFTGTVTAPTPASTSNTTDAATTAFVRTILPPGVIVPYGGSSAPTGWLLCDGSAVSRATYSALFTAISTAFGVGDGSTTFNVPDMRGRAPIGAGTGATSEAVTTSSGNGFVVGANNTKWITGMAVVLSNLTGFTTSASVGPTYYAVRISSTNVRLATTLALAQNGTPDVTISGTGTATLTSALTARTSGEVGGEEAHAMSSTELLAHTHVQYGAESGTGSGETNQNAGSLGPNAGKSTQSKGGNAAMNNMQPFLGVNYIIKT